MQPLTGAAPLPARPSLPLAWSPPDTVATDPSVAAVMGTDNEETTMTSPIQLDLLSWEPPQPTLAFDEASIRAATPPARIARGVSTALRECGLGRVVVAQTMSDFLGEQVSPAMLDAYASQARDTHRISVPRFMALLHATRDRRLLEMLAQPFGWAAVERRHLPLIQVAQIRDREDALRRQRAALSRRVRGAA